MAEKQGEFELVILEAETESNSHSLAGPWGTGLTSSAPSGSIMMDSEELVALQVVPRANDREVDPRTLKTQR